MVPEQRAGEERQSLVAAERTKERAHRVRPGDRRRREEDEVRALRRAYDQRERSAREVIEEVLTLAERERVVLGNSPSGIVEVGERRDRRDVLGQIGERQERAREERQGVDERANEEKPAKGQSKGFSFSRNVSLFDSWEQPREQWSSSSPSPHPASRETNATIAERRRIGTEESHFCIAARPCNGCTASGPREIRALRSRWV